MFNYIRTSLLESILGIHWAIMPFSTQSTCSKTSLVFWQLSFWYIKPITIDNTSMYIIVLCQNKNINSSRHYTAHYRLKIYRANILISTVILFTSSTSRLTHRGSDFRPEISKLSLFTNILLSKYSAVVGSIDTSTWTWQLDDELVDIWPFTKSKWSLS